MQQQLAGQHVYGGVALGLEDDRGLLLEHTNKCVDNVRGIKHFPFLFSQLDEGCIENWIWLET